MALKITHRDVDGISVMDLDGRVSRGVESEMLREKIRSSLAGGQRKIILNMARAALVDSAGLSVLLAAGHSATALGARMTLCSPGKNLQRVLQATELTKSFEIYDSENSAILSFLA